MHCCEIKDNGPRIAGLSDKWTQNASVKPADLALPIHAVTGSGVDSKAAAPWSTRFNFDDVISADGSSWGMVCDGVLIANISGHFGSNRIDIF